MTSTPISLNQKISLNQNSSSPRTLFGLIMTGLTVLAAVLALLPLLAVIYYLLVNGASQLSPRIFTELIPPRGNGLSNAIVGTLMMVTLAALLAVPFGVMAAIYVSEFGGKQPIVFWIRFATNVLSGVPSIVVGVFAFGSVVLTMKALKLGSFSAIAGSFALAVLMLPIIVRTTEESLKLVPQEIRQAAVGIGATKFQTVFSIVLPAALPAIVTGAMLAVARAAGETAPLIFTALSSQYFTKSLLEPTASLSVSVYKFATSPFVKQQQLAWAGSLVLVVMILLTSIASRMVAGGKKI